MQHRARGVSSQRGVDRHVDDSNSVVVAYGSHWDNGLQRSIPNVATNDIRYVLRIIYALIQPHVYHPICSVRDGSRIRPRDRKVSSHNKDVRTIRR